MGPNRLCKFTINTPVFILALQGEKIDALERQVIAVLMEALTKKHIIVIPCRSFTNNINQDGPFDSMYIVFSDGPDVLVLDQPLFGEGFLLEML